MYSSLTGSGRRPEHVAFVIQAPPVVVWIERLRILLPQFSSSKTRQTCDCAEFQEKKTLEKSLFSACSYSHVGKYSGDSPVGRCKHRQEAIPARGSFSPVHCVHESQAVVSVFSFLRTLRSNRLQTNASPQLTNSSPCSSKRGKRADQWCVNPKSDCGWGFGHLRQQSNRTHVLMQTHAAKLPLAAHSHSSDSGEMSSMSERKLCRNCVLLSERCRRLQYSLGRRSAKLKEAKQRWADEGAGGGDGGGHLGATNTCPEDSKELGSSDCMSAKHREGSGLGGEWERDSSWPSFHLSATWKRTPRSGASLVLTLQLQHHVAQVCLDEELVVRRQHQAEAEREGQAQGGHGSVSTVQARSHRSRPADLSHL